MTHNFTASDGLFLHIFTEAFFKAHLAKRNWGSNCGTLNSQDKLSLTPQPTI